MSNLCANGCGFYGHPSTRNLCSQCYKKFLAENSSSNITLAAAGTENSSANIINNYNNNNNSGRCKSCNKKIGLLGFGCRCGGSFCGIHRHPETHACPHDFRTPGRTSIAQANPQVKPDKHPDRL